MARVRTSGTLRLCVIATVLVTAWILGGAQAAPGSSMKPRGGSSRALQLRSLEGKVTLEGPLATSRTVMVFHNPYSSRIEADFEYTAPPGAVIHYFAYWFKQEKVVARIVERERAAEIYRSITARNRDPALVENLGNRRFRVRIFPVEPTSDLRVEVGTTQVLPSSRAGFTYTFPFERDDVPRQGLDSISLAIRVRPHALVCGTVNNYGLAMQGDTLVLQGSHYVPGPDLKVTQQLVPRTLQAFVHSGRVGGSTGFFVLDLRVARPVEAPRVSLAGPGLREVVTERVRLLGVNRSMVVTGCYDHPGTMTVTLRGRSGVVAKVQVPLGTAVEPGNPAATLWAASRIGELEERGGSAKAVTALSRRFNVPSRFTSWLAVPKAEWARYQAEKAAARREALERARQVEAGRTMVPLIESGRRHGRDAHKIDGKPWHVDVYQKLQHDVGERWLALAEAGLRDSAAARRLRDFLRQSNDGADYELRAVKWATTSHLASMLCGGQKASVRYQRAREILVDLLYIDRGRLDEGRSGGPRSRLEATKDADRLISDAAYSLMESQLREYARMVARDRAVTPRARALKRSFRQANLCLDSATRLDEDHIRSRVSWAADLPMEARQLATTRHRTPPDSRLVARLEGRLRHLCKLLDLSGAELEQEGEDWWRYDREMAVRDELRKRYGEGTRDLEGEQRLESEFRALDPDADGLIASFKVQGELKQVRKRLDSGSSLSPEGRIALESQRDFLVATVAWFKARYGDPLIQVQAPSDAQQVTAILPDGQVKPMAWNPRSERWEAHFDIPTHQREGHYTIQVVVVAADGKRETQALQYDVQLTPPEAQVRVRRLESGVAWLECEPSEAARRGMRRVVALLPWGARVDLVPDRDGRRWSQRADIAPAWVGHAFTVTFIVTDAAHNRRELTATCTEECAARCDAR